MRALGILGLVLLTTVCVGRLRADEAAPIFDVPRIDHITIDGKADDWGDRGFRVGVLGDESGKLQPAQVLDASFRLAWDERGLLLLLNVSGDVHDEAKTGELWSGDSVEIFYSPQRGSPDVVQMVISPGMDPERPELRSIIQDERHTEMLKKNKVAATAVRTKTANGYTLEVLLPWANFGIQPAVGREVAFQLYVNDVIGAGRTQVLWYPISGAHDSMKMNRLRLTDKPSPAINALASADYAGFRNVRIHVSAAAKEMGKTVVVKESGRELGTAQIVPDEGRGGANVALPMPPEGKAYGPLDVYVDGEVVKTVELPSPEEARANAFRTEMLSFQPSVFPGPGFPKCDFDEPLYVQGLIGPYTITTAFYDAAYQRVTTAGKPGRYGAVVEIKTEDGKTYRRLRTLFRTPGDVNWWEDRMSGAIQFPAKAGIDPTVEREQSLSMESYLRSDLLQNLMRSTPVAALLAGLYETKPGAPVAGPSDDFAARDRQWWVGLKRKLSGADALYPKPFVCPEMVDEKPAAVLREGTLQEAGMKPGAAGRIDALLNEWEADSGEPFAVCVARHGVIVLHKAYGVREGQPMTVDTKSWMASITKTLSGTLMMMLVDQGLVNLDDPVSKFLPAFAGVEVKTPLTIRHLYTHTDGLEGEWGSGPNDLDDVIAGDYPYLQVGKHLEYNGVGPSLGSKIVEMISGEALPQFYKHHLLDPLGCAHTDVTDSSGRAESTPMDIAKVAQMLLNRGSYGNKRFMSAKTFQQMLPERLTQVLGPDTTEEWGIGLVWCKDDGLGKGTFGHGAASSATFRIDPTNDLVIVMCRNAPGRDFTDYHRKFMAAIIRNLAD